MEKKSTCIFYWCIFLSCYPLRIALLMTIFTLSLATTILFIQVMVIETWFSEETSLLRHQTLLPLLQRMRRRQFLISVMAPKYQHAIFFLSFLCSFLLVINRYPPIIFYFISNHIIFQGLARSMPTSGALDRVAEKLNLPFFEVLLSMGTSLSYKTLGASLACFHNNCFTPDGRSFQKPGL